MTARATAGTPGSTPLRSAVQPTREATRVTRPTISDWDLDDLLICAARYAVTTLADDPVRARTADLVVAHVPWLSGRAAAVVERDLTGWSWPDLPARDDEWAPVLAAVVDRPEPTGPRPPLTPAELDDLLLSCTYYAVGRATYVTSWMAGLLRWHAPWLAPTVRDTITAHIRSAVAAGRSGWDCDTEVWQQALSALTAAGEVSR